MWRKGLEDLNVYRDSRKQDDKVREDLNAQRLLGRVRGTGPRATVKEARRPGHRRARAVTPIPTRGKRLPHCKRLPRSRGACLWGDCLQVFLYRLPYPRHATIAADRPPHYKKTPPFTVGRGPVPRHHSRPRTLAGDRPPRYEKTPPFTVGRGPVPRHA